MRRYHKRGRNHKRGTGYHYPDGGPELPEEIEHICPDYSLYPDFSCNTVYGFLTRGCPRGYQFCIVGEKEGRVNRKVADLSEFWKGQRKIVLLDPNMFACADWEGLSRQLIESNAWVDFSQGCQTMKNSCKTPQKDIEPEKRFSAQAEQADNQCL